MGRSAEIPVILVQSPICINFGSTCCTPCWVPVADESDGATFKLQAPSAPTHQSGLMTDDIRLDILPAAATTSVAASDTYTCPATIPAAASKLALTISNCHGLMLINEIS